MPEENVEKIAKKLLKWHKAEMANVGKLTMIQKLFASSSKNLIISQVKMLYDFSRVLGIVFCMGPGDHPHPLPPKR